MVWLTGASLSLCAVMIISLLLVVVWEGSKAFWVRPIDTLTLTDGSVVMGVPMDEESYEPSAEEARTLAALLARPDAARGAFDDAGRPLRRLYRVGNREFNAQPFLWVPLHTIARLERDPSAVLIERVSWGVWIGRPEGIVELASKEAGAQPRSIATGTEATLEAFARLHGEALERRRTIERINTDDVGRLNKQIESVRLDLRNVELRRGEPGSVRSPLLGVAGFVAVLVLAFVAAAVAVLRARSMLMAAPGAGGAARLTAAGAAVVAVLAGLLVSLEHPWSARTLSAAEVEEAKASGAAVVAGLESRYEQIREESRRLEAEDARVRLLVRSAAGQLAPLRQSDTDQPMLLSQVVRAVPANAMSLGERVSVYLERWGEFLFAQPRESNTEGGIFPVIFGTVILTILLSVVVVPLGVVAALYLREYATQGPLTSAVRIAVNNLAGVPSIVYGVFGLGFFCYSVGSFVDGGPSDPWPVAVWWGMVAAVGSLVLLGVWSGQAAAPARGQTPGAWQRRAARAGLLLWIGCCALAVAAIAGTPYFEGFYRARQPSPTFGTKGLLWASLTLALLTLPVVIVATEEAIAAVPRSMREGSYACGGSKWQTIQRIVLPRAMPGIMTGMILAMARGAGEVAPLMLVGAVKLAPELVVSADFPFVHLDRSFMHLGFHIYDVGLQGPDSQAARPIVWCTTLVLIVIVVLLTTTAVQIRAGLRRKYLGGTF